MIGKLASDLFDRIAQCDENPNDADLRDIMVVLGDMKKSTTEIEVEDLKDYVNDFIVRWNNPAEIKSDFDSLTSETNELMVELGNEGYFDAMDAKDVDADLNLNLEDDLDDEYDDEFEE